MNQQLRAWLASADTLRDVDAAVAAAAQITLQRHAQEWSAFELDRALGDIWRLSQDQDCCYDRPSIGPTYAMWYHGQRTHDAIRLVGTTIANARGEHQILDLGAGTGTTLFAAGLIIAGLVRTGQSHANRIHIRLVDASPFMLAHAQTGWEQLIQRFREIRDLIVPVFECATWPKATVFAAGECIVVGSYMFDHSDATRLAELALGFRELLNRARARELFLLAAQPRRAVTDYVANALTGAGWTIRPDPLAPSLWNGTLGATHQIRTHVYTAANLPDPYRWLNPPPWNDNRGKVAFRFTGLEVRPPVQPVAFAGGIDPDIRQLEAATPDDRPTLVFGAAGSGKSIVLAERVCRVVANWQHVQAEQLMNVNQNPIPSILVTGFNKDMVRRLKELVYGRLGPGWLEERNGPGHFVLRRQEAISPQVTFANWDLISTRILRFPANGSRNWEVRIAQLLAEDRAGELPEYARNEEWLLSELRRIIWGQRAFRREAYCGGEGHRAVDRVGRQLPLQPDKRQVVWDIVMESGALHHVHRLIDSHRRLHPAIELGAPWRNQTFQPFTHVFVDECQDFTRADFDLLAAMTDESTRVFATGDHAQSLRLGRSCPVPGLVRRRRWQKHELLGSYRLPLRICEAVRPIAEFIGGNDGVGNGEDERLAALPQSMKAVARGVISERIA